MLNFMSIKRLLSLNYSVEKHSMYAYCMLSPLFLWSLKDWRNFNITFNFYLLYFYFCPSFCIMMKRTSNILLLALQCFSNNGGRPLSFQ